MCDICRGTYTKNFEEWTQWRDWYSIDLMNQEVEECRAQREAFEKYRVQLLGKNPYGKEE